MLAILERIVLDAGQVVAVVEQIIEGTLVEKFIGLAEFVNVVEQGSFTQAAILMGVSKSHISKKIAFLESRLDIRLFQRSTRTLILTDAGRAYYEQCVKVLSALDEAESEISRSRNVPEGTLKISAPVTLGEFFISALLADFAANNPLLRVDFDLSTRNVSIIDEGYDLAVRIGHLEDSSLIATRLADIKFCVSTSPDYLAQHGAPTRIEELSGHNCLVCSSQGPLHGGVWKFSGAKVGETHERKVKGSWSCNNCYGLITAARRGVGLIWLPDVLVAKDLAMGNLVTVLDEYCLPSTIWAVYPSRKHVPAKVTHFIEYLREAFGSESAWRIIGSQYIAKSQRQLKSDTDPQ